MCAGVDVWDLAFVLFCVDVRMGAVDLQFALVLLRFYNQYGGAHIDRCLYEHVVTHLDEDVQTRL